MSDSQCQDKFYSLGEEIANSITHGLGVLLSCGGLTILIVFASLYASAWQIVSVSIFGATMVMLFLSSTFYHALTKPKHKKIFRIIDHAAIFLLIAGTYTPLMLNIRGGVGWSVFGVVWGLAIIGVIMKVFWLDKFAKTSVFLYVCMGWLCIFTFKQLFPMMPTSSIVFLLSGGVVYTLGVVFYLWEKLPYNHAIWHLFVLGGSTLHFFSMLFLCLAS